LAAGASKLPDESLRRARQMYDMIFSAQPVGPKGKAGQTAAQSTKRAATAPAGEGTVKFQKKVVATNDQSVLIVMNAAMLRASARIQRDGRRPSRRPTKRRGID